MEALLRDVELKGYLDKEYAYRLRQKEAVKGLKKRIEGQINGGEIKSDEGEGLHYDPLLESNQMGMFERYFRRALEEDIKSTTYRALL